MFGKKKVRTESLSQIFLQQKPTATQPTPRPKAQSRMSKAFLAFLAIICTTTVTAFFIVKSKDDSPELTSATAAKKESAPKTKANTATIAEQKEDNSAMQTKQKENRNVGIAPVETPRQSPAKDETPATAPIIEADAPVASAPVANDPVYTPISRPIEDEKIVQVKYRVRSSAPVYKRPSVEKGKIALVKWQKSFYPFNALAEENGFIYAIVANNKGYEVEGWLRKKDLVAVNNVYHASDLK